MPKTHRLALLALTTVVFASGVLTISPLLASPIASLDTTTWTSLGPAPILNGLRPGNGPVSGRITGIAAHPTNPNIIYVATAGGGVWKTTDGGTTWNALTDSKSTLTLGSIAIAPGNPQVLYAGTGEWNNSLDSNFGRGVLLSTDAGATWTLLNNKGAFDLKRIPEIAIDPSNTNVAYIAVNGCDSAGCYSGIHKTTDGGSNWSNTTSAVTTLEPWSSVRIDPNNPSIVYAAVGDTYGSAQNGVYKSTNGGVTWSQLTAAPSGKAAGRIVVAVAKTNSQVIYVSAAGTGAAGSTAYGALYKMMRSDDGGSTFTDLTATMPNYLGMQGWYDTTLIVDPTNSAIVYAGGQASVLRSTTSGATWTDVSSGSSGGPHINHHAAAFDAAGRYLDGDDGGIYRLDNPTTSAWTQLNGNLNTIQFRGIGLHPTDPNIALGGSQSNGVARYTGSTGWTSVDTFGGLVRFSQTSAGRVYHQAPLMSVGAANFFRRSDDGGVTWVSKVAGIADNTANLQSFYAPFAVDPRNGDRVLYGARRLWESVNGGESWAALGPPFSSNIVAIGLSPSDPYTIYVATEDGYLFSSNNHGSTWTSRTLPNAPVQDIQVDPNDPLTAYAAIRKFKSGAGNVFRTIDGGTSWIDISGSLPDVPAWSLQIDPGAAGTLYLGNDIGVYRTTDGGISWSRFGAGLPNAQVYQIELNATLHILGAGTYGRGLWEIQTASSQFITALSGSGQSATAGTAFASVLRAKVTDAASNPISGAPVTFTAPSSGAGATFGGSSAVTVTTDASGIAASSLPVANNFAGTYNVTASAAGLSPATFTLTNVIGSAPGLTTFSLWSNATTPANLTYADPRPIEVGVRFKSDVDGAISGIRFYKGPQNTGTHTVSLWTTGGALLARSVSTSETASGWQQANFASPVNVTANTTYVASYHTTSGYYSYNDSYFLTQYDNAPLHALPDATSGGNGLWVNSLTPTFPTQNYRAMNFWVDVVLAPSVVNSPPPPPPPPPPPTGGTYSLWTNATTPANVTYADPRAIELGVRFKSDADGAISGIRFYKGPQNTGTHTVSLWTTGGTLLARSVSTSETASGWQTANFASPVNVSANTTYIASYHTTSGYYSYNDSYFINQYDNAPLHALPDATSGGNGLWINSLTPTFPTQNYRAMNFWVDVVWSPLAAAAPPAAPPDATPPAISSIAVTNITSSSATVNWTTDEPADGQVEFIAPCPATGCFASLASALTTSHAAPLGGLTANTLYVYRIRSKDSAGNLTITPNQTFTTATAATTYSLWGNTTTPTMVNAADSRAIEIGVKFKSDMAGAIYGIRFFKGSQNTGTHTVSLWTTGGTLLTRGVSVGETASGWQQVNFASPVNIAANTTYVASYHTTSGFYSYNDQYFTSQYDNAPLHALSDVASGGNGLWMTSSTPTFPTQNYRAGNFWVDVVLGPSVTPPVSGNTYSLWNNTVTPAVVTEFDPRAIELGVKFKSDVDGSISAIRFYKGPLNTGTHTVSLWTIGGALLARSVSVSETASGWQQVNFASPVTISANTTYIVSYHTTSGYYSYNDLYFTTQYDNAPLHALAESASGGNGVWQTSSMPTFPTQPYRANNFWVDVVFIGP